MEGMEDASFPSVGVNFTASTVVHVIKTMASESKVLLRLLPIPNGLWMSGSTGWPRSSIMV